MFDLKKLQNRYKVIFEESYQYAGELDRVDPDFPFMYQIIAGKHGEIYAYDNNNLAVYVRGSKRSRKTSSLDSVKLHWNGYGEAIYLFKADNLGLLNTIAKIIYAHKKRQVSAKERDRLKTIGFRKQTIDPQNSFNFTTINACTEGKKP